MTSSRLLSLDWVTPRIRVKVTTNEIIEMRIYPLVLRVTSNFLARSCLMLNPLHWLFEFLSFLVEELFNVRHT